VQRDTLDYIIRQKKDFIGGTLYDYHKYELVARHKIIDIKMERNKDNRIIFIVCGERSSRSFDIAYFDILDSSSRHYRFKPSMNDVFEIEKRDM